MGSGAIHTPGSPCVHVLEQAMADAPTDRIAFEPLGSLPAVVSDAWRQLHAGYDSHESVYAGPDFFAALAETQSPGSLVIATHRCALGDSVEAVAPLRLREQQIDPHGVAGRILRRRMRVWALSGSEPLVPDDARSAASIGRFLCTLAEAPGEFDALELQSVDVGSPTWQAVSSPEVRQRFRVYLPNGVRACHQTPLPETQEAYLAQFPRKKRYNLSRQIRQIGENLGGPAKVVPLNDAASIDALFDAVRRIGDDGGSLLTRAEYAALAKHGLLLNFVVQAGGEPIAAILGIPSGSVYRIHRVLYAQKLSPYSPGTSTLHMLNEWMIADGRFRLVDFGFGEPGRTYSSSNRLVNRARVYLVRRSLRNRLSLLAHRLVVRLEAASRSLLNRTQTAWGGLRRAEPAGLHHREA